MDIAHLTSEQRAELKAQLMAEDRAEKLKREENVAAYKDCVDEFCRSGFKRLAELSAQMRAMKILIFKECETLVKTKEELYNTKLTRHSNTFTSSDGRITIALGYRTNDGWDDTVSAGIAQVYQWLKSAAKDEQTGALCEMVHLLLANNAKGDLRANRVIQLEQAAKKAQIQELVDAVGIIRAAYRPVETCQFISVSVKDEEGKKHAVPLSLAAMTDEEIPKLPEDK